MKIDLIDVRQGQNAGAHRLFTRAYLTCFALLAVITIAKFAWEYLASPLVHWPWSGG